MIRTVTALILLYQTLNSFQVCAQHEQLKGYTIHIELLGTGMLLSGTIETALLNKNSNALCFSLGASGWFFKGKPFNDQILTGFTGGLNYLRGSDRILFETGIGLTYLMSGEVNRNSSALFIIPRVGIRMYSKNGKFIWRGGITPPIHLKSAVKDDFTPAYIPFIGVSVGRYLGR
ncbi:MAG: hypothetical protein WC760_06695 [Bacteroidia bacterium]